MRVVRFAPSPTGVFHIGNLRTAWVASQLSRFYSIPLHLRFEDIDSDRSTELYFLGQKKDLSHIGLSWQSEIRQSEKWRWHHDLFVETFKRHFVYPCTCSRRVVLEDLQRAPHGGLLQSGEIQPSIEYSGRCRNKSIDDFKFEKNYIVWRLRGDTIAGENDFIIGHSKGAQFEAEVNSLEFQSWRPSYNWACAADDFALGDVIGVRAWDLASVYFLQRRLVELWSQLLNKSIFYRIFHASLILNHDGQKISKRDKNYTLKECLSRIESPEKLNDLFMSSWESVILQDIPSSHTIWGEVKRSIKWSECV